MRHLSISLFFALFAACGTSETPVIDLSTQSQVNLCENYLDDVCFDDPTICDDPCIDTGCPAAAANGDIDANCDIASDGGPITAEIVEDCAAGDLGACSLGGDCMLDALDDACAP